MSRKFGVITLSLLAFVSAAAFTAVVLSEAIKIHLRAENMPSKAGKDFFDLGRIDSPRDVNSINPPHKNEAKVLFKFETEDGRQVNLVVRRDRHTKERHQSLKLKHEWQRDFKDNEAKRLFGKSNEAITTSFLVQIPGTDDWVQKHAVQDPSDNYRLGRKFSARIYPNGVVLFHSDHSSGGMVMINAAHDGKLPLEMGADGKLGKLEIGKNRFVDMKDELKAVGLRRLFSEN